MVSASRLVWMAGQLSAGRQCRVLLNSHADRLVVHMVLLLAYVDRMLNTIALAVVNMMHNSLHSACVVDHGHGSSTGEAHITFNMKRHLVIWNLAERVFMVGCPLEHVLAMRNITVKIALAVLAVIAVAFSESLAVFLMKVLMQISMVVKMVVPCLLLKLRDVVTFWVMQEVLKIAPLFLTFCLLNVALIHGIPVRATDGMRPCLRAKTLGDMRWPVQRPTC
ncbi:unnamed protein product [Prorocentrum cordatum]|uniref:Uncharacterized protein n=1 Tax=Prorocentrum cordatum TaxID=2364126 RepID=A0ABN9Q5H2_9DINO|nr:unnamed protein product [Polarella glacialis]